MIAAVAAASTMLHAHPANVTSGTITWIGDRLVLTVADPHAFHELSDGESSDTARELPADAHALPAIFIVTSNGKVLRVANIIGMTGSLTYTFETGSADTIALLAQAFDGAMMHYQQLQLTWQPPHSDSPTTIRLTNGGNHAVLQRNRPADASMRIDPFNEPVMALRQRSTNENPDIDIEFPATILCNWSDLLSRRKHTVSTVDFRDSKARIRKWAEQQLAGSVKWNIQAVELIDPHDQIIDDTKNASFAVYTTRIRIKATTKELPDNPTLTWTGFNPAFLRMPLYRKSADSYQWIADLTPTNPSAEIPPTRETTPPTATPPTAHETTPTDPSTPHR